MSSDETNREPQARPEPPTAPGTGQAVTPEQLADAVRARAERPQTLPGGPEQAPSTTPAEVAREITPAPEAATTPLPVSGPASQQEATPAPIAAPAQNGWARPTTYSQAGPAGPGAPVGPAVPPPYFPGQAPGQMSGQAPGQVSGQFPPPGDIPPGGQFPPAFQPPTPKKMGTLPKVLIAAAAAIVLSSLGAGTVGGVVGYALGGHNGGSISVSAGRAVIDGKSLSDVAEKVQASVVGVSTGSGQGSGVVFDSKGYILTNNHVVEGASGSLTVTFSDGRSAPAKLVGTDPTNDLAVIKVDQADGLQAIIFGDSEAIKIGDPVLAIGNPLGLDGTVTAGILSAKNRTISEGGGQNSPFERPQAANRLSGLLQTDAAINPGNSGGALVDSAGRLMGINTAIATSGSGSSGNIGVGFAIPSNKARSVAEQLMKDGKVGHPYIGVEITKGDAAGGLLSKVTSGSPAAQAGLQQGDLVTSVNGKAVKNSDELVSAVQAGKPGDKLALTVVRGDKTITITVTVGEAPN